MQTNTKVLKINSPNISKNNRRYPSLGAYLKSYLLLIVSFALVSCGEQSSNSGLLNNNQAIKDYESARRIFWQQVYPQGGETLYCAQRFGGSYNKGLNIEHVFPMSWVTRTLGCGKRKQCRRNSNEFNLIEADLHNLYPSRSDINHERSNIAFGIITGEQRRFGKCDFEIQNSRPRLVEPREQVRGNIARAMLYMADRYNLDLFDRQIKLLKKWHIADPVDDDERRRNQRIKQIQGNANSYIEPN